ncbi:MAG: hypothetical protein MUC64_12350 [Rubritepida sp.]|jgi:hypothetical protein|nr:hypothetical protein [Rubritepida sp.]
MRLVEVLPWLGGFALAGTMLWLARQPGPPGPRAWRVPAGLALAFLGFSLAAVLAEGPLGFWPEHTRNLWGNQIWFDLLLAAGVAWALMLPRARAAGMRPLPWLPLILGTGSIGLLAMLARLLQLEARARG